MICDYCKEAGDSSKFSKSLHPKDKVGEDHRNRAKLLHVMCVEKDCFCQHRQ